MNSKNQVNIRSGVGFTSLLTLLFVALKLTGYISWSWWWVLSPVWIVWTLFFTVVVLYGVFLLFSK